MYNDCASLPILAVKKLYTVLYDPFSEIAAAEAAARAARTPGQAFAEDAPNNVMNLIGSFLSGKAGTRKQQVVQLKEKVSRPPGGPGAGTGGRRTRRKGRKNSK